MAGVASAVLSSGPKLGLERRFSPFGASLNVNHQGGERRECGRCQHERERDGESSHGSEGRHLLGIGSADLAVEHFGRMSAKT